MQWKPDVLVTQGPMVFGARAVTGPIPVVFGFSGDPVEGKLVASLARPGGSLTGISLMQFELIGKRLEVLKEAVPGLTRVALLANTGHPGVQEAARQITGRRAAPRVHRAVRARGYGTRLRGCVRSHGARACRGDRGLSRRVHDQARRPPIADFAARRRIAAISGWAEFATAGDLLVIWSRTSVRRGARSRATWTRS